MWSPPPPRCTLLLLGLGLGLLGSTLGIMPPTDPLSSCSVHLPLEAPAPQYWHRAITTGSPVAQALYDQAILLMAAFNHEEAVRSLDAALDEDPSCLSCLTMLASALSPNINRPIITQEALDKATQAVNKVITLPPFQYMPVEQAMASAMAQRFPFERTVEGGGAVYDQAYADALAQIHKDYPDDVDIAVWYAEAALTTMPWAYYEPETNAPKALTQKVQSILEDVLANSNLSHPLALHLWVHLLEPSTHSRHRALPAADALRKMEWGPGHSHLMHMPGHIYVRTGQLHAASEANQRALESDRQYFQNCSVPPNAYVRQLYATHNMAFLLFSAGLEGRKGLALETAELLQTECNVSVVAHALGGSFLAYPAWQWLAHDLRFGLWELAAAAQAADDDVNFVQILQHYVRAFALASLGKCGPALMQAHAFHILAQNASVADMDVFLVKAGDIFAVAEHSLNGRLASMGCTNQHVSVHEWTRAVALVDAFPYMEPPFWPTNLRACLGQALLDERRFEEAEKVYIQDLVEWPGNGWSLKGLELALWGQGKQTEARMARRAFEEAFQYADFELGEKSCF